jgi:hypothetical protein
LEIRRLIREISIANPVWEHRESMVSFSSSASMSARPSAQIQTVARQSNYQA